MNYQTTQHGATKRRPSATQLQQLYRKPEAPFNPSVRVRNPSFLWQKDDPLHRAQVQLYVRFVDGKMESASATTYHNFYRGATHEHKNITLSSLRRIVRLFPLNPFPHLLADEMVAAAHEQNQDAKHLQGVAQ